MQSIHVPKIGPAYWAIISVASIFGANLGDFVSHDLHGGHWRGLAPLALVLGAIFLLERRSRRPTDLFYWLAIITVRTAATNLADLVTHDARLPYAWAVAGLALLLIALLSVTGSQSNGLPGGGSQVPATGGAYWLGMLLAGTLGTAIGDGVADEIGLGVLTASVVLALVTAALLGLRVRLATAATYWAAIVGVRAAGTTLGDLCAGTVGLEWSTLASLLAFAVLTAVLTRPVPMPVSAE